jgi:hypothetical protein
VVKYICGSGEVVLKIQWVASCRRLYVSRLSDDQYHLSDMEPVVGESVCHSAFICWVRQSSYKRHGNFMADVK